MREYTSFALERGARRGRGADRDVHNSTSKEHRSLQCRNAPRADGATSLAGGQVSGAKVVGVDEVGRGCLAGPLLVVAARAYADLPPGLKDSKLLSREQREEILNLLSICCNFGEGWVKASEIDRLGLSRALTIGATRALQAIKAEFHEELILDGKFNYLPKKFKNSKAVIDGDNLLPIVSAASIYAKVTRDRFMAELAKKYPAYGFENHVGYGTKTHMLALKSYGAVKYVHRYSFAPVANLTGV